MQKSREVEGGAGQNTGRKLRFRLQGHGWVADAQAPGNLEPQRELTHGQTNPLLPHDDLGQAKAHLATLRVWAAAGIRDLERGSDSGC